MYILSQFCIVVKPLYREVTLLAYGEFATLSRFAGGSLIKPKCPGENAAGRGRASRKGSSGEERDVTVTSEKCDAKKRRGSVGCNAVAVLVVPVTLFTVLATTMDTGTPASVSSRGRARRASPADLGAARLRRARSSRAPVRGQGNFRAIRDQGNRQYSWSRPAVWTGRVMRLVAPSVK